MSFLHFTQLDTRLTNKYKKETIIKGEFVPCDKEERGRLLTEILFLSRFWKGEKAVVLYLGSPETIISLASLFPCLKFHLYGYKGPSSRQLIFHEESFGKELAYGWKNTNAILPVYLISYLNKEEQLYYYETIKPREALLQYFPSREEEYCDGFLIKRPWSSSTSLIVQKDKKIYNIDYHQAKEYHDRVIRKEYCYCNLLDGKELPLDENLNNSYDATYEVFVICDYLKKIKEENSVQNVLYLSSYITSKLTV